MNDIIRNIEAEQLKENAPEFHVGDTVKMCIRDRDWRSGRACCKTPRANECDNGFCWQFKIPSRSLSKRCDRDHRPVSYTHLSYLTGLIPIDGVETIQETRDKLNYYTMGTQLMKEGYYSLSLIHIWSWLCCGRRSCGSNWKVCKGILSWSGSWYWTCRRACRV